MISCSTHSVIQLSLAPPSLFVCFASKQAKRKTAGAALNQHAENNHMLMYSKGAHFNSCSCAWWHTSTKLFFFFLTCDAKTVEDVNPSWHVLHVPSKIRISYLKLQNMVVTSLSDDTSNYHLDDFGPDCAEAPEECVILWMSRRQN